MKIGINPKIKNLGSKFNKLYKRFPVVFPLTILIAVFAAAGLVILIHNSLEQKSQTSVYTVIEPDAPVTTSLVSKTLGVDSSSSIVNNNTKSLISDISFIENLKYSPDGTKVIILSWTSDPSAFKKGDPTLKDTPTLKLILGDSSGNVIKILEDKDILNADFSSNNQIYFQKLGDNYGIFAYIISLDKKVKFIETSDSEAYKNIVMVSDDKYFFVQPKTGNYGFGTISNKGVKILGQKAVNQNSLLDNDMASYSNVIVSPDKKQIAFYDSTKSSGNNKKLLIFNSDETKFDIPLFSADVEDINNDSSLLNNTYSWSSDGTLLTLGTDSTTIDITNKKVVFKGEKGKVTKVSFSPDKSKAIVCDISTKTGGCNIKDLNSSSLFPLPKDISSMNWLDNDNAVFVVGNSIYNYKLGVKKLEKIKSSRANYKILSKDSINNSVVIQQDNSLFEVANLNN